MSSDDIVFIDVRIQGRRDQVAKILHLLDLIDMCRSGCSRMFKLWYDGDGGADLNITLPNGEPIFPNPKERDKFLEQDVIKIDID